MRIPAPTAFFAAGCLLAAATAPPASSADHDARPNVVLLIIDTLRGDALGCAGIPDGTSPEIDALARRSLYFRRVVAPCTWTRPSVASMVTSLHPRTLGIYDLQSDQLADRFVTVAEVLKDNGYRTLGVTANVNLSTRFNFHQGFDVYVDCGEVAPREEGEPFRVPTSPEIFGRVARETAAPGAGPWFVLIDVMDVHEYGEDASCPVPTGMEDLFAGSPDQKYLRAVRQTSRAVGDFVRDLRGRPGWESTLFIVTSDHGEGLRSHPGVVDSYHHGRVLYESNAIVPWIVHSPDPARAPRRIDATVGLIDLAPTLLDLLGIAAPPEMAGRSVLDGDSGDAAGEATYVTETHFQGDRKIGIYAPDWKLLVHRDWEPGQGKYQLELQANERPEDGRYTDRKADNPELVRELGKRLRSWESEHPEAEATQVEELDEELKEQLRAVGYVD
ncbi:MAG TPA: sulfatase [bacterium]|nr:sulfatase [bacterium]